MYKKLCLDENLPEIDLYFEGRLDPANRWIKMANFLPWSELEDQYSGSFKPGGQGALNVRIAMGALLIKEILGLSDREVPEMISENPYLQYFLGFKTFQNEAPFHHSLMTSFRKRLPAETVNAFNEKFIRQVRVEEPPDDDPPPKGSEDLRQDAPGESGNAGTILLDATCAPADIKYPTDLNLVNEGRELAEQLIDELRILVKDIGARPRTRAKICRRRYLEIVKHPKCGVPKRRKALRFLLNALRRNLEFIESYQLAAEMVPAQIAERITVLKILHAQQREMLEKQTRRVADRIVSLHQPHVRPMVRGKAGREVEFGAKLTASMLDGYTRLERLSWDSYHEAGDLQTACARYFAREGHYPEAVLADKLFRNRENLRYCAERGIRLSGPKLGRPPKNVDWKIIKQELADSSARNAIEGKFGQCKRRLGMGRVMARRRDCSETAIAITILAANLIRYEQQAARLYFVLIRVKFLTYETRESIFENRMAA